jgi:hypothetical protein
MRRLFFSLLMFCVLPAWADGHDQLYKVAGWPEQRAHFNDALSAAQQRYRNSLPPAVYQALVNNSNQRFAAQAMDQRAEAQLRKHLADPKPALAFSSRRWGARSSPPNCSPPAATSWRKTPRACRRSATTPAADHRPPGPGPARPRSRRGSQPGDCRRGGRQLEPMIPGLLGGGQAQGMLNGQRQR